MIYIVFIIIQETETVVGPADNKPTVEVTGRRASFGFLRRVSRALKSRNSLDGHGTTQLRRDELKRQSKREKQASKRNAITEESVKSNENKENKPKRFDLLRKSKRSTSSGEDGKEKSGIPVPKGVRKKDGAPLGLKAGITNVEPVIDDDIDVKYAVYRKIVC